MSTHASESGYSIRIASQGFSPRKWSKVSSAIRERGSLALSGAQKNGLRRLWPVHLGWYDRKRRRARDLSCADTRVHLEFEVRRVRFGAAAA